MSIVTRTNTLVKIIPLTFKLKTGTLVQVHIESSTGIQLTNNSLDLILTNKRLKKTNTTNSSKLRKKFKDRIYTRPTRASEKNNCDKCKIPIVS